MFAFVGPRGTLLKFRKCNVVITDGFVISHEDLDIIPEGVVRHHLVIPTSLVPGTEVALNQSSFTRINNDDVIADLGLKIMGNLINRRR